MSAMMNIIIVEWRVNRRNFLNVFFSLMFPIMMLLLFGSIYTNDPSPIYGGHGSVDVSTAGYLCMVIAVSGLMTLPITLSQYRERKILKRFMATPIKPIDILSAQLVVNSIITGIGSILLIVTGIIVFDLQFYGNVFEVFVALILVMLGIFAIGLFIAGVTKNAKASLAISYVVYFPMLFLSGATLPLQFMPKFINDIANLLPLTYGINLVRGLWFGQSFGDFTTEVIVLIGTFIVFGTLSLVTFKWE
jgi:ABC-2 type transport system permease protein